MPVIAVTETAEVRYRAGLLMQKQAEVEMAIEALNSAKRALWTRMNMAFLVASVPFVRQVGGFLVLTKSDWRSGRFEKAAQCEVDSDGTLMLDGYPDNDRFRGETDAYVPLEVMACLHGVTMDEASTSAEPSTKN